ncbi:MAG: hypothetical protein IH606_23640 [Burkholderiales bacterium]|nr:hypothetical protein [Burkholderiales bacterium]
MNQLNRARSYKKLSSVLVLIAAIVVPNIASARDAGPSGIEWQCVQQYDPEFNIRCITSAGSDERFAQRERGGYVKSSLPVGGDLRTAAEVQFPEVVFAETWSVPLYTPPRDAGRVLALLQTLLCDTAARCAVSYRSN